VDCIGLLGHWTFEQDAMDVSGAGWHGAVRHAARVDKAKDVFTTDAKQGRYSLRLTNIPSIRGGGESRRDCMHACFAGMFGTVQLTCS